ncbi:MAG TPA: hypothetical protein EYQ36_04710, partial [Sulfitobacter sp.]|nr:hypothetical protein [Sulfitobacter sp.]
AACDQDRLAVVVVGCVMAMAVHRPSEVFFQPVRMPMLGNHLRVVLDCLEDQWRVGKSRHQRKRRAEKHCKQASSCCVCPRHRCPLAVLFGPPCPIPQGRIASPYDK